MSILEHHFPPSIAEKYGVNAAIFLRDIYHWCESNRNNNEYFYEGRWWTYQTINALCRRHTYWTKNQVEHIIRTCKKNGALLSGHFNENQFDRTCWYTLTDEVWALFNGPSSFQENSEMDSKEISEVNRKNQKCYKEKYKTKDKNPITPCGNDPDWILFDRFWAAYPKKKNKDAARKAWRKLNPDLALCRVMSAALERDKRSRDWLKDSGAYIPHPSSWLNGRRWEDEPEGAPGSEDGVTPVRPEGGRYI